MSERDLKRVDCVSNSEIDLSGAGTRQVLFQ